MGQRPPGAFCAASTYIPYWYLASFHCWWIMTKCCALYFPIFIFEFEIAVHWPSKEGLELQYNSCALKCSWLWKFQLLRDSNGQPLAYEQPREPTASRTHKQTRVLLRGNEFHFTPTRCQWMYSPMHANGNSTGGLCPRASSCVHVSHRSASLQSVCMCVHISMTGCRVECRTSCDAESQPRMLNLQGCGLFQTTIPSFTWRDWKRTWKLKDIR